MRLSFHKKLNRTYILTDFTDISQALKTRELEIVSFYKQRSSLTLQKKVSIGESRSGEEILNF